MIKFMGARGEVDEKELPEQIEGVCGELLMVPLSQNKKKGIINKKSEKKKGKGWGR